MRKADSVFAAVVRALGPAIFPMRWRKDTGKALIPAMQRRGYGDGFAGAVIAAGALLGPMIPPSIPMVVYAQIANESVARLFLSGVLPAILLSVGFIVICSVIARRRGDHNRLGFSLQMTPARSLGLVLADPLDVPNAVLEYLADQLDIADPSCVKRYTEHRTTRFEHAEEITGVLGLRDFAEASPRVPDIRATPTETARA